MYLDRISIKNFRTFRNASIGFLHPDRESESLSSWVPALPNVNLILGNNGFGKTTLLKAIALACLGPAVGKSGIYPYRLVRREPIGAAAPRAGKSKRDPEPTHADIQAVFRTHSQDQGPGTITSRTKVRQMGDLETFDWSGDSESAWDPIFSERSDALFFVGYGASRRTEQKDRFDAGVRRQRVFARAQRVQSLFEDDYSLVPLNHWLPELKHSNKGRHAQVVRLMNALLGAGHYRFTGDMEGGEYLFEKGGLKVPFPALSDGYRANLGWVGDLLFHVCTTCPSGRRLVENQGIVMIDEIDLHLHPKWQMEVLPTLAKALPRIQFIVTSHSPLVVGSLEWKNIVVMKPSTRQAAKMERVTHPIHGLDADQILLTEFFGLQTTRSGAAAKRLKELSLRAGAGDLDAARQLLERMSRGTEATEKGGTS